MWEEQWSYQSTRSFPLYWSAILIKKQWLGVSWLLTGSYVGTPTWTKQNLDCDSREKEGIIKYATNNIYYMMATMVAREG